MKKADIIKTLQQAAPEHIDWVRQGRMLVKGIPEDQIKKPNECDGNHFTEWYKSEGYKLVNIPQLEELSELNQEISKLYTALYYMTFDRRKQARSTLILAGEVEVPVEEIKFRKTKLDALEEKIITMLKALKRMEQVVSQMDEMNFDSVWFA